MPDRIKTTLSKPEQRFLARALTRMREPNIALLTNTDILAAVPPSAIMAGFEKSPERRADILEKCAGLKRKLALSLTPATACTLLEQALSPQVADTTPDQVCEVVTSDEFVKLQDAKVIWQLLRHKGWFLKKSPATEAFLAHLLEEILAESLLDNLKPPDPKSKTTTAFEMARIIGFQELLSDKIPGNVRGCILETAIMLGEQPPTTPAGGRPAPPKDVFNAARLFGILDGATLTKHLDFPYLDAVVQAVAIRFKWMEEPKVLLIEPENEDRTTTPPPPNDAASRKDPEGPEVSLVTSEPSTVPAPIVPGKLPEIDISPETLEGAGRTAKGPPPLHSANKK